MVNSMMTADDSKFSGRNGPWTDPTIYIDILLDRFWVTSSGLVSELLKYYIYCIFHPINTKILSMSLIISYVDLFVFI